MSGVKIKPRTNLVSQSERLDLWKIRPTGVTVTPNYDADPLGGNAACLWSLTSGDGYVWQDFSLTNGSVYTFSLWVKVISASANFQMQWWYGGSNSTAIDSTVHEWVRYSLTFLTANSGGDFGLISYGSAASPASVLIFGAMLELAPGLRSYIRSSGTPGKGG